MQDPQAGVREPRAQPAVRARRHRALLHDLSESRLRSRRRHHSKRLEVLLLPRPPTFITKRIRIATNQSLMQKIRVIIYRVFHTLADLGSFTICPILLKQMGFWQNWLSNWASEWNISNLSQPNSGQQADGTPCTKGFRVHINYSSWEADTRAFLEVPLHQRQ